MFAALKSKGKMITLQLIGWGVILATTLFWSVSSGDERFDQFGLACLALNIVQLILIYILNYKIFIPKYLFNDNKGQFFVANAILIALLLTFSYYVNEFDLLSEFRPDGARHKPRASMVFLTRDMINYILMVGLVTALRLADRLQKSEEALREAESARVKAELANLRSQINPHFLLNTLNNIYALTAIDTDKAQKTIKELSDLLRYILYDNLEDHVLLIKEIEFLKSYIELMSIRLPRKVSLSIEFNVSEGSTTEISPLIFISLIENAFKHSVGANGEGFIEILFEESVKRGEVTLWIKNSNCAKADQDKSGHGIGLEQVRRRLELLYPDRYVWDTEQTDAVYSSRLTLKN